MQILHTLEPQKRNWEESVQRRYFKTWDKTRGSTKERPGPELKTKYHMVLPFTSILLALELEFPE